MRSLGIFLFVFLGFLSKATHNRSGEITYKRIPPYTKVTANGTVQIYWYAITVVKYTDDDTQPVGSTSNSQVLDRCADTVYFGDGDKDYAYRNNGGLTLCSGCKPCDCNGKKCGELIINESGYRVKKNVFYFEHLFPGPGTFTIRTSDPNRNTGVLNMLNSDQQLFYIQSVLVINSFSGANNSPEFTVPPIDKACLNKCFTHSPGAYDADHDSLVYKMSTPKGANGITVSGYFNPPFSSGGSFGINARSGVLTWCTPTAIGEYNIAFVVEEWRKSTNNSYYLIGSVLRDMQVVVKSCANNNPPVIVTPRDTCVVAGAVINKYIKFSDPDISNIVTLTGHGGAFSAASPNAVLTNTIGNGVAANFNWQTTCDHIARQSYNTTFRAEDNVGVNKLVSYNAYNIRVVPPALNNVTATPIGSTIKISWSLPICNPISNPVVAYKIYRKEGCLPFINEPCATGVAASSGFVLLSTIENDKILSFVDNNGGDGLVVGQNYSYLVIAVYKDGIESIAGSGVCAKLKRDVPVLLNVDVLSTSTSNGTIKIRWARPLKTPDNLDTLAFPGPYRINLLRKSGNSYIKIFTSVADYLYLLDTEYAHTTINTTLDSNEYLIEFASGTITIGSSQKATSLFLITTASDRKIDLSWKSKTPWKNYTYTVFRKAPLETLFTAIATTTNNFFSDKNNIANKNTYCYYVLSEGEYSDPLIERPLLNRSQEVCATAIDLTPPCTPSLNVIADCKTGFVNVNWQNVRAICSDDVINFVLYYKNTVSDVYQKVFETDSTTYFYDGISSISGCYAIQAQDSAGNLSALSQDFCIDNCPEFELPNIFSPNKDDVNDFYKAIKVRQVKEIDLAIVDRWGNLVYTTKDPYFQWDGISLQSNQMVSEGTFFYVCTVYEKRVKGPTKRILKGTVQVVR